MPPNNNFAREYSQLDNSEKHVPVIFMPEFLGAIASGYSYRRKQELRIISVGALRLAERGRPSRANPSCTKPPGIT
jgi:hypothetical protein